jgi:hypothetical protein
LQVSQHHFNTPARDAENNDLDAVSQQIIRQVDAFLERAAPDAQVAVHNGWVID